MSKRATEGFYDTALNEANDVRTTEIVPTNGGLDKRQRCAVGLA